MKVVVVGAEGFVGRELVRRCRLHDIEVTGIDTAAATGSQNVAVDIRSSAVEDAIPEGTDALVHLAAVSRAADCKADPPLAYDVNVLGTLNLLRAAQRRGVKQFIFASSEWVYGDEDGHTSQTEDQPIDITQVRSEYALSKLAAEQSLRLAYDQSTCAVTVLRFGIVYGPRPANWSAVEALFDAVRTQDSVSVGSLETARRFIHVSDISSAIISAIGRDGFDVFNVSGDTLVTLRDVIHTSGELLDRWPEITEKEPSAVSIRNPDNRKARELLEWAPAFGLKEGLTTLMENGHGE